MPESRAGTVKCRQLAAPEGPFGYKHPRQGRIIAAITSVLRDSGEPIQARAVHAEVQILLGESVRWASVKATLAGNLDGAAPKFVRVARGRYGIRLPGELASAESSRRA